MGWTVVKKLAQFLLLLIMFCPVCKDEKVKSKVYYMQSSSKLVDCEGFWDEEGVFHQPKCRETSLHSYRCTNGHSFVKTGDDLEEMVKSEETKNKEKKK